MDQTFNSGEIHFVLDSISFRKAPNMLYYDICPFSQWKSMWMMKPS